MLDVSDTLVIKSTQENIISMVSKADVNLYTLITSYLHHSLKIRNQSIGYFFIPR